MTDAVRNSLCEAVDGSILMGHMQELARWVKLSGTPDELQSLRYFQNKLDEYGYRTVEDALTVYDLHATVLHLLGLDHERLTYRYGGRDYKLTSVGGARVVDDVIA